MAASTRDPAGLGSSPTLPQVAPVDTEIPALDGDFGQRYQVKESIGQGGMGEVRLCTDVRIGRDIAMKVVRAGAGSPSSAPEGQARFYREARVQGQLEHPSIVPVYDLGRDLGGALYFTMKRVRGETLADVIGRLARGDEASVRAFTRRKLLTAFASVCQAVDFGHSRGVIHRDLKPGNVMLGDFGEVYVLDWGLAKLTTGAAPASAPAPTPAAGVADPRDTTHGTLLGTPGYMSPEQAAGHIDQIDARSDVYALGAILFELLALRPLHDAATTATLIASTIEGVDARPSVRAPERDIPPELEAICVRATALEPAQRFPGAGELCRAVERFLDGDRDLALRRDLAAAHARAARAATDRLFGEGDEAERVRALREAGRALALEPEHPDAAHTVLRVLTTPPRRLPADVAEERRALAVAEQRSIMRIGTLAYLSWLLYVPLALWMGIASYPLMAALALGWTAAAAGMYRTYRRPTGRAPTWLVVFTSFVIAVTGTHFGPLVMLPGLATLNMIGFMMGPERRARPVILAAGVLAVLAPAALEWAGLLPASYSFSGGTLVVHSFAFQLRPQGTLAFLVVVSLQIMITASVAVARMRDLLSGAEERLMVQAWQLRQLVPEQTAAAMAAPAPRPADPSCIL